MNYLEKSVAIRSEKEYARFERSVKNVYDELAVKKIPETEKESYFVSNRAEIRDYYNRKVVPLVCKQLRNGTYDRKQIDYQYGRHAAKETVSCYPEGIGLML